MSLPPPTPPPAGRTRTSYSTPPTTPRTGQQGGGGAGAAGASPVPRQRARDLLRAHYGLDGPSSPRQSAPSAGEDRKDPMDLDSTSFDPHIYYTSLIKSSSLSRLIKTENDLDSQIRLLDSERHALIYNNHQDLVAASDTIQKMNAHTSPLADSLDLIRSSFSTISQLTASVSLPPAPPSAATSRVVREVADLPERLSDLVALGESTSSLSLASFRRAHRADLVFSFSSQVGEMKLGPSSRGRSHYWTLGLKEGSRGRGRSGRSARPCWILLSRSVGRDF
ncbi:Vps51/Vps67-domain-containing protein [Mrakia frigida]|uniref:COG1/VPS51 family protein n=1 Tax=Mrakia frigida TaxID=29902 RepID=UPI003FCBF7D4